MKKGIWFLLVGVLLSQGANATQLELVCPCTVSSVGLTGVSITAGVTNVGTTASGDFRYKLKMQTPGDTTFFLTSVYRFNSTLNAGASLASTEVKTGLILPDPGTYTLVLTLEENQAGTWTKVDQIRMKNRVTTTRDGGKSFLTSDEESSGALFFDGAPTLSISGSTATISLPDLVNSSASVATGPLELDILQSGQANVFVSSIVALSGLSISNGLGPRGILPANTYTATITDSSEVYSNLRVLDTAAASPTLLFETVRNTGGDLPVRTLNETGIELITDNDSDGVDNYSERLVGTNPDSALSTPPDSVVDVLVIYSQSVANVSATIDQLISVSNTVLQNGGAGLSLNLASSQLKTIDESLTLGSLLNQMDDRQSPFDDLVALKENAGADIVVLILPYFTGSDLCGLANLGGFSTRGDLIYQQNEETANATVYVGDGCEQSTFLHEVGHVMGLGHSRRQDGATGGTLPWAVGYGIDASFVTVMAYGSEFSNAPDMLSLSSPLLTCEGVPCGIARTDAQNGADAVLALRTTRYQVQNYRASLAIDTDNDGTPDSTDTDDDNDGVADGPDAFPLDASEFEDTDADGTGNNADTDDDNDGVADTADAFPLDSSESADADGDGVGDNADVPKRLGDPEKIELTVVGASLISPAGVALSVPANATAVSLNVTAVNPVSAGFVTVWPCSADRPVASNLNYVAGRVVPNGVIAPIGSNGKVCLYSRSETDLVVDVAGWFVGDAFAAATPTRLVDTRDGTGAQMAQLQPSAPISIKVTSLAVNSALGVSTTIPASIDAVALNVTVVNPSGAGFVTVYPCDVDRPLASNLNYTAGNVVANGVVAPVSADGEICIYSQQSTDVIVDLAGWIPSSSVTTFIGTTPTRLVDTRDGTGGRSTKLDSSAQLSIPIHGVALITAGSATAVPNTATAAAINVTVVSPESAGFATVWPCSASRPLASNLNFVNGQVIANNVVAPIGTDGAICVFTNVPSHVIVDVSGYFTGDESNAFVGSAPARFIDTRSALGPGPK